MGADEVLKVFYKHPEKEFTIRELSEVIDLNIRSIIRIIHSLLKESNTEVHSRLLSQEEKCERYKKGNVNPAIKVYWIGKKE